MDSNQSRDPIYREVLRPPVWLMFFIFFLFGSIALSIWAAFDDRAALIALGLSLAALVVIYRAMTLHILVDQLELRVGRAHMERKYLGRSTPLTIDETRLIRGRDADPAAYLALRFWQPKGVKIEVEDSRDPTPYWLVSSKNTKGLVEALAKKPKS